MFRASIYQANQAGSELPIISAARKFWDTCIGCIAQIPRFRALPSLLEPCCIARNIASLPASLLGTLLLYLLMCSEHCFLLCSARNSASMLCSEHCFYARNTAFLPDPSALCLLLWFARNPASLQAPSFRLSLIWNTCVLAAYSKSPSFSKPGMFRAYGYQQCGIKKHFKAGSVQLSKKCSGGISVIFPFWCSYSLINARQLKIFFFNYAKTWHCIWLNFPVFTTSCMMRS